MMTFEWGKVASLNSELFTFNFAFTFTLFKLAAVPPFKCHHI